MQPCVLSLQSSQRLDVSVKQADPGVAAKCWLLLHIRKQLPNDTGCGVWIGHYALSTAVTAFVAANMCSRSSLPHSLPFTAALQRMLRTWCPRCSNTFSPLVAQAPRYLLPGHHQGLAYWIRPA